MRLALALVLAALGAPAVADSPEPGLSGWATAYAPGVMEGVIAVRHAEAWWPNRPPWDWHYRTAGAIATMDCRQVGRIITLRAGEEAYPVLVADCIGPGDPERFARDNIIAELDARLWARLTAAYGRPLRIGLQE